MVYLMGLAKNPLQEDPRFEELRRRMNFPE
jgi:hypothetical protein